VGEVVRLPREKDVTDAQYAVDLAIKRGASELVIVASTSGRFDHTASLLAILQDLWEKRIPAMVVNGQNRGRVVRNSGVIIVRSQYKYFSVVALDEKVKGVSIEGAKYPLKSKEILRRNQFAVSNEIVKNCALITVKKGAVYVVESRDAAI
jgi:thiamine pyrophosphokinase